MDSEWQELADLIVEGRSKEAFEQLRDILPRLQLPRFEIHRGLVAARKAPQPQPFPSEAEIDARHDRAINSFETVRKANEFAIRRGMAGSVARQNK